MPLDTTGLCRNYDEDLKTIKVNHNDRGKNSRMLKPYAYFIGALLRENTEGNIQ